MRLVDFLSEHFGRIEAFYGSCENGSVSQNGKVAQSFGCSYALGYDVLLGY